MSPRALLTLVSVLDGACLRLGTGALRSYGHRLTQTDDPVLGIEDPIRKQLHQVGEKEPHEHVPPNQGCIVAAKPLVTDRAQSIPVEQTPRSEYCADADRHSSI